MLSMDPCFQDDPSKPKVFALAGFFPVEGVKAHEVQYQKEQITTKLTYLGGQYLEGDEWDTRVTHVIMNVDGKKEGMSEKVMAAIAAGRWVLTRRFIEESYESKKWILTPHLYAQPRDIVLKSRRTILGHEGSLVDGGWEEERCV